MSDLRFAFRQLLKNPGFTTMAVLTLALGIGANTAIFSLMDAVMLRRLPVADPGRLVLFGRGDSAGSTDSFPDDSCTLFSYPMFRDIRQKNEVFSEVAAIKSLSSAVHGRVETSPDLEQIEVQLVSGSYFPTLGLNPLVGRTFTDADDRTPGGHPVAVASYSWWSRRFGREPSAVGKTLTIGSTVYTIIGIAPPEFFGTAVGQSPDLWIPLTMEAQVLPGWNGLRRNLFQSLYLIARLKTGVDTKQADANLNVLFRQILRTYGPSKQDLEKIQRARIDLTPFAAGLSRLRSQFSTPLRILMAVVALVLLIACANIANLMLARAASRCREVAIRMAVGAAHGRLIRQLLTESLLLAVIGGFVGIVFAWWASHLLVTMVSSSPQPTPIQVAPDVRVLTFTLLLSALTALVFGIAPALRATRIELSGVLKDGRGAVGAQTRSLLARALMVVQVALSLVLASGAGLFLRSLVNLTNVELGFDKENVLLFQVDESSAGYKEDSRLAGLYHQVEERVSAVPGVSAASFSFFTFNQGGWYEYVSTPAQASSSPGDRNVSHNVVGAGYFAAMGIPLVQGRGFGPQDTEHSAKVAIINDTLARKFFPKESALGHRFRVGGPDAGPENDREVIGIVRDARSESVRDKPRALAYYPYSQRVQYLSNFEVRFVGQPIAIISAVRRAVGEIDRNLPLSEVTTLADQVDRSIIDQRLIAQLSSFFGLLAVFLACVGIYGLMSYTVSRRTNEIGIRLALGAQPGDILYSVLRETLLLVSIGVVVGLPMLLGTQSLISSQLYGLTPTDPLSISIAALLLVTVAALAGYLPARRAASVDPMVALRYE